MHPVKKDVAKYVVHFAGELAQLEALRDLRSMILRASNYDVNKLRGVDIAIDIARERMDAAQAVVSALQAYARLLD